MITTLYNNNNNNESDSDNNICVDICEVLYNILNQIYKFDKVIVVREIKDIRKISNTINSKTSMYVDISNYAGSKRTVLRRLNLEAFININTTIITVIPTNILKFAKENCMNLEIEYIPNILQLNDCEIELEEELAVIIFNSNSRGDLNEY